MKIDVRKKGNVSIVSLQGRMSIGEGDVMLRERMKALLEDGDRIFVLDMVQVPWLDSASIGEIVACYKRIRERQGQMKVAIVGKAHTVVAISGLDRVFELYDDVEAALASFVK